MDIASGLCCHSLRDTSPDQLVECMLQCFADYFVPFGGDTHYWAARFENEGVDYSISFGMFTASGELVGFVVHAINGDEKAPRTAYNAGTGVLPAYRGQHIISRLYEYGIPLLKEKGIELCILEVIEQNEIAIRVYSRIGFERVGQKSLACFKGFIPPSQQLTVIAEATELIPPGENPYHRFYSWDSTDFVLKRAVGDFTRFEVSDKAAPAGTKLGFFIISQMTGYLPQFEIYDSKVEEDVEGASEVNLEHDEARWRLLFDAIAQVHQAVSLKNVDNRRCVLIKHLKLIGLENFINQNEMKLSI